VAVAATNPPELDLSTPTEVSMAPCCASERWPEPAVALKAPSPKEHYTTCYRDADACRVGCCDEDGDDYK
jgi:hypothetical protein